MKEKNINFIKVTGTDFQIKVLFELLEKRIYKISHKKMPDYKNHEYFVKQNPYKEWYLIKKDKDYLGSFYIKYDNSIGLNLSDYSINILSLIISYIKKNFTPENALESMIPPYFYMNTSSENKKLHCILNELKLTSIQISYKL